MFKRFCFLYILCFLFLSCTKKEVQIKDELITLDQDNFFLDFYHPAFDDGSWVEQIIASLEEERVAQELDNISELENIIKAPYEKENEVNNPVEIRLLDSQNRLKLFEYGNEFFVPDSFGDNLIFINKDKDKVMRTFYDEKYRLQKKEFWSIKSPFDFERLVSENYFYKGDTLKIDEKIMETKEYIVSNKYDDQGNTVYFSKKDYKKDKKKYQLVVECIWNYDSKNRVVLIKSTDYSNKNAFEKKETYIYNSEDEIPPDYEYYENGQLKIQNKYSSKDEYCSITRFDSSTYVIAYYKNGNKIKDAYYKNDILLREKLYE